MIVRIALVLLISFASLNLAAQNYAQKLAEHRKEYKADFLSSKNSPLKEADLNNLVFFDADSTYIVKAKLEILSDENSFQMPTYDGTSKPFVRYALAKFNLKGSQITMTLYQNVTLMQNPLYKDLLFLPFTDLSNGKETYSGGKYIDLKLSDIANNEIEIDFNKAYNPYCAYSDGYRCPVPPKENALKIAILAGEKTFKGEKKHRDTSKP